jgi:hypothetical protein
MTQPEKQKKPATKRKGFTRISISLPDDLLAELDAAAAADNRTRSNFLTHMIRRILTNAHVSQGLPMRRPPRTYCPMGPDDAC